MKAAMASMFVRIIKETNRLFRQQFGRSATGWKAAQLHVPSTEEALTVSWCAGEHLWL
jgi:hypothetical protein